MTSPRFCCTVTLYFLVTSTLNDVRLPSTARGSVTGLGFGVRWQMDGVRVDVTDVPVKADDDDVANAVVVFVASIFVVVVFSKVR